MRLLLVLFSVLAVSSAVGIPKIPIDIPDIPLPSLDDLNPVKIAEMFADFVKNFGKEYANPLEQSKALANFGDNLKKIIQLNLDFKDKLVEFGVNQFSDLTSSEFAEKTLMKDSFIPKTTLEAEVESNSRLFNLQDLPTSLDWRDVPNVLGRVGNQGNCGCCYAFAGAAGAQAAYGIKNKKLVQPSEQQLCDCGDGRLGAGCNGGNPINVMEYVQKHGVSVETAYVSYSAERATVNNTCEDTNSPNTIHVSDVKRINRSNATKMLPELVAHGPLVVLYRVGKSFQYYKSGIFSSNDCDQKSTFLGWHAVLVIGYGEENGTPYWIVRNSWSPAWGEDGHFRFIRGTGVCRLETDDVGYAIG